MGQPQIRSTQLNESNITDHINMCLVNVLRAPIVITDPQENEILTYSDSLGWTNKPSADTEAINFKVSSMQADETTWRISNDSSQLTISTQSDNGSVGNIAAVFERSGTSIDSITFNAPTIITKSGLRIQSKAPSLTLSNDKANIDEKVWDIISNGTLQMRTRTDAFGTGATFLEVERNGTTPSLIRLTAKNIELVGNTTITNLVNTPTSVKPTFTIRKGTVDIKNDPHLIVKASQKAQYFRVDVYLTVGGGTKGGTGGFRWNVGTNLGDEALAGVRTTEVFRDDGTVKIIVGQTYGDTTLNKDVFPKNTASVKITYTFKLLTPESPTFTFQWAQETATTSGVTLEEGCNMVVTPLG